TETVLRGAGRKNAKAWFTRAVETSLVPTIWITNSIAEIDRAVLRRFRYVVAFDVPPRPVRIEILATQFEGLKVSDAWLEERALEPQLPAGVSLMAARAAAAPSSIGAEQVADRALAAAREVLELADPQEWNLGDAYDPA